MVKQKAPVFREKDGIVYMAHDIIALGVVVKPNEHYAQTVLTTLNNWHNAEQSRPLSKQEFLKRLLAARKYVDRYVNKAV